MDNRIVELLKKCAVYILFPIIALWAGIFVVKPLFSPCIEGVKQYTSLKKEVKDLNKNRDEVSHLLSTDADRSLSSKDIFKPEFTGDLMIQSGSLLEDMLVFAKESGLQVVSIEYAPDTSDSTNEKLNKITVNIDFLCGYLNFNSFLAKTIEYPYLVSSSSIDVKPYEKDKTKVIISYSLDLYTQK